MVGASLRGIPASYNRIIRESPYIYTPSSQFLLSHSHIDLDVARVEQLPELRGRRGDPISYLQLSNGEATTSANAAVVLDGRASHNRAQLVNWTGSNSSGLGETGLTTAVLAAGLYRSKKSQSVSCTVPIEICVSNPFISIIRRILISIVRMVIFVREEKQESVPGRSARGHDAASPCGSL